MKIRLMLLTVLLMAAPLSGCIESGSTDETCTILPAGHDDDGTLRILTYDISALSDLSLIHI